MKPYSLIWQHYSKDSETGKYFNVSDDFALPYFIDGSVKERFETNGDAVLSEIHLLRGVLVGYSEKSPLTCTEQFKAIAPSILEDLRKHFSFATIEQLIVNIAAFMRKENGGTASFKALLNGVTICPESSVIKFDCCSDLMPKIKSDDLKNRAWGINKFKELVEQVEENDINPEYIENLRAYKSWIKTLN